MKTILLACLLGLAGTAAHAAEPLATIPSLEVPRYLGNWYEIAKYPNRFQRQCASDTVATYAQRSDGTLDVTNRCRRSDGSVDEAHGQARQRGGPGSPRLQVRFAPAWLSFVPMVWGDYWVIDLDPDYQLVAVSEPKREYLWVLARQPQVAPDKWEALMARLVKQGLDPARLERTPQSAAKP
ncbi:lipocalin family protein [Massilia sp. TS11]|uniref:lipocalin family protein n=1 Tax=Massilia sp. TS11 TaxID=2908003 RepID=UPI001EDBB0D7|nr:lipocalin family protein [Massilia sp. TS11]MCG2585067.1 lipocalin family protein [Massilia sp. TS11]